MDKKHIIEFFDKFFELQNEYGLYIHSANVYEFDNNHNPIGYIHHDSYDGYDKAFYIVRFYDIDGESYHYKYAKQKH